MAEEYYASDVTDFRSQLTKLFDANPDALHLAPQSEASAGTIIKQARELGFDGPIYAETISVGTTALEIAGDAATGMKAITADLDPDNEKAQQVLADFRERYKYVTLPWHLGSAYDDVYIAPSASSRPATIRMPTASATVCTRSPGAARSATTTALTSRARWLACPESWWKSCRRPSGQRTESTSCSGRRHDPSGTDLAGRLT